MTYGYPTRVFLAARSEHRSGEWEAAPEHEPCYVISVAARMVGVHAQTLRYYERLGLVAPARSRGNIRMYSLRDVQQARWIKSLMDDLGINLAGVDVIIRMGSRLRELEEQVRDLAARLQEAEQAKAEEKRSKGSRS